MNPTRRHPHWREMVTFAPDGPRPAVLLENARFKLVLVGLEAGQQIPPHPAEEAAFHILDGTGWVTVDGERVAVEPGVTVVAPGGSTRGVQAETRLVFLGARAAP